MRFYHLALTTLFSLTHILDTSFSFVINHDKYHVPMKTISLISSSSSLLMLPLAPSSQPGPGQDPETQSTPAYILIEAKITDYEKFSDYAMIVPSIVKQYGGEYIVLRGKHTPLEGEWGYSNNIGIDDNNDDDVDQNEKIKIEEVNQAKAKLAETLGIDVGDLEETSLTIADDVETKIVLQKWPNEEMAKRFWNSPEYAQVKKLREGTGIFRIMLIEGLSSNS